MLVAMASMDSDAERMAFYGGDIRRLRLRQFSRDRAMYRGANIMRGGGRMDHVSVIPKYGLPDGWPEKYPDTPSTISLPEGVRFFSTPGHGYLSVDFTIFQDTMVSKYDYMKGPSHALLEEDCSAPMWLAEHDIIPLTDSIRRNIDSILRVKALDIFCPPLEGE